MQATATASPASRRAAIYRIAAETQLGARTVARVIDGESVRDSTRRAVIDTAKRLRIPLPSPAGDDTRSAA